MKLILSIAVLLTASSAVLAEATNPFFKTDFYKNTFSSYSTRIVEGQEAKIPVPYIGSLLYQPTGSSGTTAKDDHICGAILIGYNTALTAESCVKNRNDPKNYKVVWGILDLNNPAIPGIVVEVNQIIVCSDPTLCDDKLKNDIAIITLSDAVPLLDPKIQPINTPSVEQCANGIADVQATFFGWGYKKNENAAIEDKLHFAEFESIQQTKCEENLQHIFGPVAGTKLLDESMICRNGVAKQWACIGDVGGPLVVEDQGDNFLVGIMSWGITPCGYDKAPSVFTSVCKFRNFIEKKKGPGFFP